MVDWQQVMEAGRELPGMEIGTVTAEEPWPGLRFRRATIAWAKEGGTLMVVRIDYEDREILLREDPDIFYITPHYRKFPGVLVRLERADIRQVRDLITGAWRARATKRQLRELDGDQA